MWRMLGFREESVKFAVRRPIEGWPAPDFAQKLLTYADNANSLGARCGAFNAERKLMFDIGGAEIVMLMILILLVMGPKNLPKVARTLGRIMGQARRVTDEFKSVIGEEIRAMEMKEFQDNHKETGEFNEPKATADAGAKDSSEADVNTLDGSEADSPSDKHEGPEGMRQDPGRSVDE